MRRVLSAALLAALFVAPQDARAQTREVTGRVTIAGTDAPLADVTVSVVGGTAVTRTGPAGTFRLVAPTGTVTIAARAIGYRRQTAIVAAGDNTVNFGLERDVLQLEGVVVTGQATTLERRNAATAVSTVQAEELTRTPSSSIENALQGKVLGASINMNSGAPGGGAQIQIRGATSILGSGEPLYVVDGVIVSNAQISSGINAVTAASRAGGVAFQSSTQDNVVNRLADLNPSEIESVEVLKSAAATAIYGSRATNGVVVIQTKRGQVGEPRFTLTQRVGTQSPLRLVGQRRYSSVEQALAGAPARDTALIRQLFANGVPEFQDFQRQLYGNSDPSLETVFSVSGGTPTTRYYVSGTQKTEEGIALNTGARLQAARVNVDQVISDKWDVSVGLNITRNTLNRGISNNDNTYTSPIYVFGYTPSIIDLRTKDAAGNYPVNPFAGGGANSSNPFQTFAHLKAQEDVTRQFGSANLRYRPIQNVQHDVTVSFAAGVDRYTQDGQVYSPGFLQFEPADGLLGTAQQTTANVANVNWSANAVWRFSPSWIDASATTSAGLVYEEQGSNVHRLRGRGLLPGVPNADQGQQDQSQTRTLFRDQAIYLNEQIVAFNERLSIGGGVRADRSSANGDREKYYLFPRASIAYRFDEPLPTMNSLKLRANYGQTGNRPRSTDRFVLLNAGGVIEGRPSIVTATAVGNPGIRPETMNEYEGGVDLAFLNDRIAIEATYYDRTITNQLLQPTVAPSTGFTSVVVNEGKLKVKGTELGLSALAYERNSFNWRTRVTYQANVQTVEDLPSTVPAFPAPNSFGAAYGRNYIRTGTRTSYIWGNAPVRLNADGTVAEILPVGSYVTNPSAVSIQRDTVIGDANPKFQMAFSNDLAYRRFGGSFLFDWRNGGDVVNLTNNLYDEGRQARDYDAPSPVDGMTLGQYRYNAWNAGRDARIYVQDGSFVKLREVSLWYDVPTEALGRINGRLRSARVQLLGRNLAMWTSYWGSDPEFNNFGAQNLNRFIDLAPYPPSRQYYLSVDVGF